MSFRSSFVKFVNSLNDGLDDKFDLNTFCKESLNWYIYPRFVVMNSVFENLCRDVLGNEDF